MTLHFSIHATQRMEERGITEDEVREVYENPLYSYPNGDGARTYVGENLVVAVGKRQRVITTHRPDKGEQTARPLNQGGSQ